jgi:exosortase
MQAAPANASAPAAAPAGARGGRGRRPLGPAAALAGLALCLLWSYGPTLREMAERWADDPQYSHGFLVPLFALAVLWSRRGMLPRRLAQPRWWGAAWLGLALLLRLAAGYFYLEPLDGLSLLPALLGVVLLLGGRPALRWAWPAVAFLAFMLPLPFQIDTALAYPLRRFATVCSTYLLQTCGLPAFAEGNVIVVEDQRFGVAEACSGLGMLMTFFALAAAVALLVERPALDKLILVASAIPIALLANVVRITGQALAQHASGVETAQAIHRNSWLMMLPALGLLWLELRFVRRLLPPAERTGPVPLRLAAGPRTDSPAAPRPPRAAAR